MNAAILENKGVMAYKQVKDPGPGPGQVRLQVKSTSICGSDIKRYSSGHRTYPMILGHECAGIIDSIGEGVRDDLLGKHAAVIPLVPCFECEQCQRGFFSACHSYSFIGSRQSGCLADYVVLPEKNVLVVPDVIPFEHAALIEPSTVGRHLLALGGFEKGQTTIVLGAGSIGKMIIQWLRILGAELIIATDISDTNLAAAAKLGAHVTLNPLNDDVVADVRKRTGDGVDIAFEAAGVPQTLELAIPVTRPHGKVVCGGNQPLDQSLPMQFIESMMRRELSVVGCFMSYSDPFPGHEWTETVAALVDGSLDMDSMISHRFSLAEAPDVFAKISSHALKHRKIILYPEGR